MATSKNKKDRAAKLVVILITALLTWLGTYFSLKYANQDAFANEKAMKYFDYQAYKDYSVASSSNIPGARLVYLDEKGHSLGPLSSVQIELRNFGDRDIEGVTLQIDATTRSGEPPVLYTSKIFKGNAEDHKAEDSVKPILKGNRLSVELQLASINRTEVFAPARVITLYFKGAVAPDVVVSTDAPGVTARQFSSQHFVEAQNARRSVYETYKDYILSVLGFFAWLVITIIFVLWARKREVQGLARSVPFVEAALQGALASGNVETHQSEVAKNLVLVVWEATYANLKAAGRWLASQPDRSKL